MLGDQCNDGAYAWSSCDLVPQVRAVDGILLCTFYCSLSCGLELYLFQL